MRQLLSLSGRDAVNRVLDMDDPHRFVQEMSQVDFYWIVKKVGEQDALPLLRLASPAQWQYLLDMEIWQKDRLDLEEVTDWFGRLYLADPERLVRWLFREGQFLSYHFLYQKIEVQIRQDDEALDLPEGFFTLDNLYYIRVRDEDDEEMIESILGEMARTDYDRYQALLLGLASIIPSEVEETMYRLRNVRLGEHGFLPHEEAVAVYSRLDPDALKSRPSRDRLFFPKEEEDRSPVPLTPVLHVEGGPMLMESLKGMSDPILIDRIRMEFAGLCNQILSADHLRIEDFDQLLRVCRKAAGYLNIGLERLTGKNLALSQQFLEDHALISIFRVGFGTVLELKWEAKRWLKEAWFFRNNLRPDFWGDEWGGMLVCILQKRPCFFMGLQEGEEYRDFEQLSEIEQCRLIFRRLKVLDRLLGGLTSRFPLDKDRLEDPIAAFHPLLFNFWARKELRVTPGFDPLPLEQVRDLFQLLRKQGESPPYSMPGSGVRFVEGLLGYGEDMEEASRELLRDTLFHLWQQFLDEYAWVTTADIDGRFTKFILTKPTSEAV
jgi:hypothetical protein